MRGGGRIREDEMEERRRLGDKEKRKRGKVNPNSVKRVG